jgi:CRP/FNR family transcriptional regulator/CRP/FNR family cyclic AMP-dependent transcriptional regulator
MAAVQHRYNEIDIIPLLSKVPLFTSLKPAHIGELAKKVRMRNYRRGEVIFHKDDPGPTLYIIKTGQVKIASYSSEGEEVILSILTENEFFGELSLLDGQPRSANATAIEATQILVLQQHDFLDTIDKHPEIAREIMAALSERLRRTNRLLEDVVFLDLSGRICRRLLELSEKHGHKTDKGIEIDLRFTQQDLADYVGASRVAVNKLLGSFRDKGLISVFSKRIIIHRPDELRKHIY